MHKNNVSKNANTHHGIGTSRHRKRTALTKEREGMTSSYFIQWIRKRWKHISLATIYLVLIGIITIAVYLIRAGSPEHINWPVSYNLSNSDNGVLFQLADDIFHGRKLDWAFSPQLYLFPEVPISLISYSLAGSSIYNYYLWVAAINNILLSLAIAALVCTFHSTRTLKQVLSWSFVCMAPLLLLPLIGVEHIFHYHLLPTYYYGMYLMLFLLPLVFMSTNRNIRRAVALCYLLTAASNPLTVVFTLPAALLSVMLYYFKVGIRHAWKPTAIIIGLGIGSQLLRKTMLMLVTGADPTSYISIDNFARKLHTIYNVYTFGFHEKLDWLLLACIALTLILILGAFLHHVRYYFKLHENNDSNSVTLTRVYLLLLPFLGTLSMFILMTLHEYYLWTTVVGSTVIFLLVLTPPLRIINAASIVILVVCSVLIFNPKSMSYISQSSYRYYNTQPPLTRCIDSHVSRGAVGYSTFSDARHYSLTSRDNIILIQVGNQLNPNFWLTNRAYAHTLTGNFFLVNPDTAELPIKQETVTSLFGQPSASYQCGSATLLFYSTPESISKIHSFYMSN